MVLTKSDITRLIESKPPLIAAFIDLAAQLQPNGFDLTLREIALFQGAGTVAASNRERRVSDLAPLVFDGSGYIDLVPGAYLVTFNEIVSLPSNVMAIARPRSSLLRCGVSFGTAVWDAGYSGRSQSLMMVYNPYGFRVQRNARIVQMIFMELTGSVEGYAGVYQGENI